MSKSNDERVLQLIEKTKDSTVLEDLIMGMNKTELKRFENLLGNIDKSYTHYLLRSVHEKECRVLVVEEKRISDNIYCRTVIRNCDFSSDTLFLQDEICPIEIGFTIYPSESPIVSLHGDGEMYGMCTEADWDDFLKIARQFIKIRKKDFSFLFGIKQPKGKKKKDTSDDGIQWLDLDN